MMLFCKFLITAVAMAILFLYCFSNCDFVGTWQHFLMFLGFKNFLWVLCIRNPMATLYLFLGPIYKHFCGFFAFHTPAQIGAD